MTWDVVCADVLDWCAGYEGPKFHAVLCDPPYHLTSGGPTTLGRNRPDGRETRPPLANGGFMGKKWDGGSIAFDPATWAAIAEHLHPGGFLMAFGGSRTYHRLACAVEDAGLIVHPAIVYLQGQGVPKSTRIDAQIEKQRNDNIRPVCRFLRSVLDDKGLKSKDIADHFGFHPRMVDHWAARDTDSQPSVPTWEQWVQLKELLDFGDTMDNEVMRLNDRKGTYGEDWYKREVIGKQYKGSSPLPGNHNGTWADNQQDGEFDITAPATPLAATWAGHRYGLQALKPCAEFLLVAQKPYAGKPVESIVSTGAGALNIEAGRVYKHPDDKSGFQIQEESGQVVNGMLAYQKLIHSHGYRPYEAGLPAEKNKGSQHEWNKGRWPPNVALSHTPACRALGVRRVRT